MHIKGINTLVGRDLPLSAIEGMPEPEVSIVEPEEAGGTLKVFSALSHWTIRVCRDLKTGGYKRWVKFLAKRLKRPLGFV